MPNHEKYDTICRVPVKESGQRLIEKAISAMKDINETTQDTNDGIESPVATYGQTTQTIEFSIVARVLGVILFVALVLLGTYLAKFAGQILLGYIVGFAGFGLLRVLWHVKR